MHGGGAAQRSAVHPIHTRGLGMVCMLSEHPPGPLRANIKEAPEVMGACTSCCLGQEPPSACVKDFDRRYSTVECCLRCTVLPFWRPTACTLAHLRTPSAKLCPTVFCSYPRLHPPLLTCPLPDHAANSPPLTKLAQVAEVDCEQAKVVSGESREQAREGQRELPACSQPRHLKRTPPADSSC